MALQAIRPHHGDRSDDFARLVDRDLDRVWRFLRSLLRDPDPARDLCHDTFLRLHESLRRGEIRKLDDGLPRSAYVFAAARNAAASPGRRTRRRATLDVETSEDIPDAGRYGRSDDDHLSAALINSPRAEARRRRTDCRSGTRRLVSSRSAS